MDLCEDDSVEATTTEETPPGDQNAQGSIMPVVGGAIGALVIAAIEKVSRIALQRAAVSVVLPAPTGPPMPTRSGP